MFQENYTENMKVWTNFIDDIKNTISQFSVNIENLQDQIDNMQMNIDGIYYKINTSTSYIYTSTNTLDILSSANKIYTASFNVYTNKDEKLYITINKTIDIPGLYIENTPIKKDSIIEVNGSVLGTKITVKTNNVQKINDVSIYIKNYLNDDTTEKIDTSVKLNIKRSLVSFTEPVKDSSFIIANKVKAYTSSKIGDFTK